MGDLQKRAEQRRREIEDIRRKQEEEVKRKKAEVERLQTEKQRLEDQSRQDFINTTSHIFRKLEVGEAIRMVKAAIAPDKNPLEIHYGENHVHLVRKEKITTVSEAAPSRDDYGNFGQRQVRIINHTSMAEVVHYSIGVSIDRPSPFGRLIVYANQGQSQSHYMYYDPTNHTAAQQFIEDAVVEWVALQLNR